MLLTTEIHTASQTAAYTAAPDSTGQRKNEYPNFAVTASRVLVTLSFSIHSMLEDEAYRSSKSGCATPGTATSTKAVRVGFEPGTANQDA